MSIPPICYFLGIKSRSWKGDFPMTTGTNGTRWGIVLDWNPSISYLPESLNVLKRYGQGLCLVDIRCLHNIFSKVTEAYKHHPTAPKNSIKDCIRPIVKYGHNVPLCSWVIVWNKGLIMVTLNTKIYIWSLDINFHHLILYKFLFCYHMHMDSCVIV